MKKFILSFLVPVMLSTAVRAQVQIDKPIQLTGVTGQRSMTNLETPVNATDAVNKAYVDARVAAGGGSSLTMISDESATTMTFGDAMRYCRNLTESGFTDWRLPTFVEVATLVSKGGTTVPNESSINLFWLVDKLVATNNTYQLIRLSDGVFSSAGGSSSLRARCVR